MFRESFRDNLSQAGLTSKQKVTGLIIIWPGSEKRLKEITIFLLLKKKRNDLSFKTANRYLLNARMFPSGKPVVLIWYAVFPFHLICQCFQTNMQNSPTTAWPYWEIWFCRNDQSQLFNHSPPFFFLREGGMTEKIRKRKKAHWQVLLGHTKRAVSVSAGKECELG